MSEHQAPDARSEPSAEAEHDRLKVGARLRAARRRQRMTLKEVATRAGISESFLSQVERGLAGVSLPTLTRVAAALGLMVADLFEPAPTLRPQVVHRERRTMMEFNGARNYLVTPRPLENLEVFWVELDPGQATAEAPFTHGDSDEVLVLLRGQVEVTVDGTSYSLGAGDSIAYRSSVPHTCRNSGRTLAEAIIALSPPSI
jgi:transcriptional regulator with XRE-family HTH domain